MHDESTHPATTERTPADRAQMLELDSADGVPLKLSPTDIAQYIRLRQCRRYLRLRLVERNAGTAFMRAWDAQPQAIPPLLTRSGREFEAGAEAAIAERARVVVCDRDQRMARGSASDNELVVATATGLAAGDRVVLFQPLLQAEIDGWALTGVADAIDLGRSETGVLSAMIVDFKSTTSARMEHRLQLAFYDEMLEAIFAAERIAVETELAVLYRGAAGGPPEDDREIERAQRLDAAETFGVEGYLERLEHAGALRRDVRALVLGDKSEARRNLAQSFDQIPFHLDYVCDGCLYNQLCLRQSAETDDLSLIPFLRVEQKRNLQVAGVRRCADLAGIPLPSEAPSPAYNNLAMEPGLGAELDDLIVRARTYRASKGDAWPVQTWLPEGRQSSLPRCDAEMHPNLVKVYIDVEHDYLHDRIYLIGALVVGAEHGVESPERRRTIVELAAAPPDDPEIEAALLRRWIARTIAAIGEVAAPDVDGSHTAPIHLIFSDSYDQRVLMNALGRHLTTVFGATSLYDFASQLAAYTSPVLTVLSDEIRTQRNYPILCQSLQALARYLRFPWDAERPLTQLFRERYFDAAGRFEDGDIPSGDRSPWYTRRSRFSSQLPLEYAYGAWKALPAAARPDPFAPYRAVTSDDLRALHAARLEAMELIAAQLRPNPWAYKQSFDLSNLDAFQDVATNLATALDEFITIERHIALGAWKHERAISPERRILSGTSMLVRYCEDDQLPEIADYNRRVLEYEALDDRDGVSRPKCSLAPTVFRLRIDLPEPTVTPEHALSLWGAAPGDVVVASARWKVDSRLPAEERVSFSPTIRQLLTGAGVKIVDIEPPDSEAEWPAGFIDVELSGFGGGQSEFAFSHVFRGFEPDGLLTLDSSPDDWYGSFQRNVVDGLRKGKRNALFDRIAGNGPVSLESDPAAREGQARFLNGLVALHAAGLLYGFEESKHRLIGGLSDAPTLLVQGPPGTGKSLTAAYAMLARIQGAMAAGRDCRVIIACKTHAAVDELMRKLVEVLDQLAGFRDEHRDLWDRWFDPRLLELPIFRFEGKAEPPPAVIKLARSAKGNERPAKQIDAVRWCVIAAGLAGVDRMAKLRGKRADDIFDYRYCDLLVLDEASQINLPEAIMGALALKDDGQVIVIGDHRQMPPIVQNDWEREVRRTFVQFKSYESLFLTLRDLLPGDHQIRFQESFRVHADIAEFLRQQIYHQDRIDYFSRKRDVLPHIETDDDFVAAVLRPEHPLTVIVHEEMASQQRNTFEQALMQPVLETLARAGFDAQTGLGVVVPHTAQRAALRSEIPVLTEIDSETGLIVRSAVDTVERFQGAERTAIVVGATESDPIYILANSTFLLDPRRLNVAISRAKQKLVLVGSRSIFDLFATDEEVFASAQLWKNLLEETCTQRLWEGERLGIAVQVWGNQPASV